jgi:hypothetical protein
VRNDRQSFDSPGSDWFQRIFNPAVVKQSATDICNPKAA